MAMCRAAMAASIANQVGEISVPVAFPFSALGRSTDLNLHLSQLMVQALGVISTGTNQCPQIVAEHADLREIGWFG